MWRSFMPANVEIRRVDPQGRLILPRDWRKTALSKNKEVYIIMRKNYLKVIPKRKANIIELFDKVDLGIDAIGDWEEFERKLAEQ